MNRIIRSTKSILLSSTLINSNNKNFGYILTSNIRNFSKISINKSPNKKNFLNFQKKNFSNNNPNKNDENKNNDKSDEQEKEKDKTTEPSNSNKSSGENPLNESTEDSTTDLSDLKTKKISLNRKKHLNTFPEEDDNESMENFLNLEKEEKPEEKEIKFPLIYNIVPIIPYSKLTLTNLHRNDLFFSLIMKYGKLNLIDEDKNYIEDIAVFFEKEEYTKTNILGTVCKVSYINQEKLIVEGLDKMFSIKSDKIGKLKFFNPTENTHIILENEEPITNFSIQEIDNLFELIKNNHDYLLEHSKIPEEHFGEYDISFEFNSTTIQNFIAETLPENKVNSEYLEELFKFTYFYIHKINTFSNLIYNHSDEFQNILHLKDIKKRLLKINESLTNMINLIKLKHVFYQFPTDLKLNFDNPFAKQTKPELNRILKYKETLDNKLSEVDTVEKQKEEFKKKLKEIKNMDDDTRKIVEKEINKISNTNFETENGKRIEYINHIFALPWDNYDEPNWDLDFCKKTLDDNLFGLTETKERIYEFIAKNMRKNNKKGCVILLTGGPGTGKTRIAKLIGEALQRKVGFISLAGLSDGKGILGFKRTYISSTPGVLIKEMQKLNTKNPVIVLDEIDKVNYRSSQSNVYHALLQLLNIEENNRFIDHYLEIPFDFSNVIFILTSNNEDIFPPLMDRMEVIKVDPYIYYEKFLILKNFAQKQILNDYCYNENNFKITDQALYKLIFEYCKTEAGVRKAKKLLEKLVRKINAKIETELDIDIPELAAEAFNKDINPDEKKNKNIIQINSNNLNTILNTPQDEDPVLEDMILNSKDRYGFCVGLFVSSSNQSNSWGSASIFSLSVREIKKLERKAKEISVESSPVVSEEIEKEKNSNNEENSDSEKTDEKNTETKKKKR